MKTTNYILNLNELLSNKTKLKSKLQILQVFLSNKCNLDCVMCCNKTNEKKENFSLDYKSIENIILTNPQLLVIEWLGGEPTLYPQFEQLLDLAHRQNIKQILVTNGSLLNKAIISKLIEYNVDVTISMDAPIKSLYEKIRIGGNFERLVKNLKLFVKEKKKRKHNFNLLTINYVVLNNNYKYVSKMISFMKKIGIRNIFFENDITNGIYNISNISKKDYKEFQSNLLNIKNNKDKENDINILIDESFFNTESEPIKNFSIIKKDENKCLIPWISCCIHYNGDVSGSVFCSCIIGNIFNDSIDNIWNSQNNIKIREQIISNNIEQICDSCLNMHPITRMYRALDRATKVLFRN